MAKLTGYTRLPVYGLEAAVKVRACWHITQGHPGESLARFELQIQRLRLLKSPLATFRVSVALDRSTRTTGCLCVIPGSNFGTN